MRIGCKFGSHRTVEPRGSLPQSAWKLDNSLPVYDNELLLDVDIINVNSSSFAQLSEECGRVPHEIAEKILSIIQMRGKLHNPVTGSGGMLLGRVKEIGKKHPGFNSLKVGDRIVTLMSLTLTPLRIDKIYKVGLTSGQLDVEGKGPRPTQPNLSRPVMW